MLNEFRVGCKQAGFFVKLGNVVADSFVHFAAVVRSDSG